MDLDRVIKRSKRLEQILDQELGAKGRGLHTKTTSVQTRLSPLVVRGLRQVATIRNKLLHDSDFSVQAIPPDFEQLCDELERVLSDQKSATLSETTQDERPQADPNRSDAARPQGSAASSGFLQDLDEIVGRILNRLDVAYSASTLAESDFEQLTRDVSETKSRLRQMYGDSFHSVHGTLTHLVRDLIWSRCEAWAVTRQRTEIVSKMRAQLLDGKKNQAG